MEIVHYNIFKRNLVSIIMILSFFFGNSQNICDDFVSNGVGSGTYEAEAKFLGIFGNNDCSVNIRFGTSLDLTPACYDDGAHSESCQNSMINCFQYCYSYRLFLDGTLIANACSNDSEHLFTNVPWSSGEYKVTIEYRDTGVCDGNPICLAIIETTTVTLDGASDCVNILDIHNENIPAYIHKGDDIYLNCKLVDNNRSDVKSSTSITLEPGFYSGFGNTNFFKAHIAICPPKKKNSIEEFSGKNKSNSTTEIADIFLYPNPTDGVININTRFTSGTYQVYNLQGKVIIQNILDSTNNSIDFSKFDSGIYLLKIKEDSGKTYFKKIIKQ